MWVYPKGLNQLDSLHILPLYKQLFVVMMAVTMDPKDHAKFKSVENIWDLFYPLTCLSAQAHVQITESEWCSKAREFRWLLQ
jgi:hypothetical protein